METLDPKHFSAEDIIKIEDFNLYYGKFHALIDVNFGIRPKEVTAIIGPSGCGKSTLLRCINRMNDLVPTVHTTGQISIDEKPTYGPKVDLLDLRTRVGMVFQRPNPFPLSVYENVAFGLKIHFKASKSEIEGRVEESFKAVGIWDHFKDKLKTPALDLSGEEKQRLCIARSIAMRPEILLMDEPCSALDPIATTKIEELIHELKERYTIVIVTHNMQQAGRVSDKTAFFYLGKLIEFDDTKKIFTNPAKKQTEEYITGRFG